MAGEIDVIPVHKGQMRQPSRIERSAGLPERTNGPLKMESIKKSGITLPLETLDTILGRPPLIHHLTRGYASATINEPLWGSTAFEIGRAHV